MIAEPATEERGLVARDDSDYSLSFVTTPEQLLANIGELEKFCRAYLKEGEDWGTIPGTPKPTLYKPGAEKLCDVYGLQRLVTVTERVEKWDDPAFFAYEVRADLVSMRTGMTVAQGVGSCNSKEARYRWRQANRSCPICHKETIFKSKNEEEGWYCWRKKDGCGATFLLDDPSITGQKAGRVENDDPYTLVNTILKMAKKRALVDAVLSATRSSGVFTQDVEDYVDGQYTEVTDKPAPRPAAPAKAAQARPPAPPVSDPREGGKASPVPIAGDRDQRALYALAKEMWPDQDAHLAVCRALNLPNSEEGAIRAHWLAHGGTYKQAQAYMAEVRRIEVKENLRLDAAAERVNAYAKISGKFGE